MKIKITTFLLVFSISTLFSQKCTDGDISLLKKLTKENITHCLKAQFNETNYLVGISCNDGVWGECKLFIFKKFANTWLLEHQSIFNNANSEIENLKSEEGLIYFESELVGGAIGNGSYYFNAYNPVENKLYTLEYSWSDYKYGAHGFENIENITNAKVLNFLEKQASQSERVYRPNNELSLEDKWKIANKKNYESDLSEFKITFNYSVEKPKHFSESNKEFENKRYIIYNQFKGNVTAFDKNTKKHFIVWMPYWFYETTELIGLTQNNLLLKDGTMKGGVIISINLDSGESDIK